jgi:hypothetical protein
MRFIRVWVSVIKGSPLFILQRDFLIFRRTPQVDANNSRVIRQNVILGMYCRLYRDLPTRSYWRCRPSNVNNMQRQTGIQAKVKQSLYRPWGFQESKALRHTEVEGCQLYAPAVFTIQVIFLILIFVRGRVDPRVLSERIMSVTPSGIEPQTKHMVAQCLNQICYHVPPQIWKTNSNKLRKPYTCYECQIFPKRAGMLSNER